MTRPSPKTRREAAERAEKVAELQRYRWRVGVVDGYWRVARSPLDAERWETLPDRLEHFADIDPVAERHRQASWLKELLGHVSAVQDLDYAAQTQGRLVYALTILR